MKIKILLIVFSILLLGTCSVLALPTLYDLTGDPDDIGIVDTGAEFAYVIDTDDPTVATIIIENAGYADQNTFGIFDPGDPSEKLKVFSGYHDPGDSKTIIFDVINGQAWIQPFFPWITPDKKDIGTTFGFYLTSPEDTYYSVVSLNSDGFDHFLIFDVNSVVVAVEDQAGGGDKDYDDAVVGVTNVDPVVELPAIPEPATFVIFSMLGGIIMILTKLDVKF